MILGIVGTKLYENKLNIKTLLWTLKNKFNNDIYIITRGVNTSTDKYVKKYCIEFEIKYGECLPYHKNWNNYSIQESFLYNKPYLPKWFFVNNKKFIDYCDTFVSFGKITEKTDIDLIDKIKKIDKIVKNIR